MTASSLKITPPVLKITLWDFSWYVRTGSGEPFEDLDRAFTEAVARGYNTVRICAMPFLLFRSGVDTAALRLGPLGGEYGQRVRWYDVKAETTIDARRQLLELFRAAVRQRCFVILSSWEYQQSPAFALAPDWYEALRAVDPEDRAEVLAEAQADLLDFLAAEGLDDRVAFTEIHNEVQIGHLTDGLTGDFDTLTLLLRPRLERAVDAFHRRHPDRLCAVNYAGVPVASMRGIPENIDVLAVHPYVYGVLQELVDTLGLHGPAEDFPQERANALLRPGAPLLADWTLPTADLWKLDAMVISQPVMYVHDWADAEAVDRWLYEHYGAHRLAMEQKLTLWMDAAADWAASHDVPLVFGEGWVGYTPLDGTFEEGPVGAELCRLAMRESARVHAWGSIVCSNAAPQHPMWADVALQIECNEIFEHPSRSNNPQVHITQRRVP